MAGVWWDVLVLCHWFGIDCSDQPLSLNFYPHIHEYQFFSRGLEGPAKAHCNAGGFEVVPVVCVGGRVTIIKPDGESVIDESLVVHEVGVDEGDDMVALVSGNIKVGNGRSG